MRGIGKLLVIVMLASAAAGCARIDQPIRPQYDIGEPYCVIRKQVEPVFDVKQVISKLLGLLSYEALRSRLQ